MTIWNDPFDGGSNISDNNMKSIPIGNTNSSMLGIKKYGILLNPSKSAEMMAPIFLL